MATSLRNTRVHPILVERRTQLERNTLADKGGKPYIAARLTRFPAESDTSWKGSPDGAVKPRVERAHLTNYTRRIIDKFTQYVFAQGVQRKDADPDFLWDASRTQENINQFWRGALRAYLTGQWCWIGVDRGGLAVRDEATGRATVRSLRDKQASGDRVFFTLWRSTEVVDWKFDATGKLEWLITQEDRWDSPDLDTETKRQRVRTVWMRGTGVRLVMQPDSNAELSYADEFTFSAKKEVPFVLIGKPSADACWMDDIERAQAAILNLESAHQENLIKAVFPQLVIPASIVETVMSMAQVQYKDAFDMVRGLDWPIMEPDTAQGSTRFISPNAADMKAIPEEVMRLKGEMFTVVGQALQKESAQVESADAKAWDHLDIETALAEHAEVLEEAEKRAVELARQFDTEFKVYDPIYPRQFDIPDVERDMRVITEIEQGEMPDTLRRWSQQIRLRILNSLHKMPDEVHQAAEAEIADMEFGSLYSMATRPPPPPDPNDDDDDPPPGN